MMEGWISLHRQITENELWLSERFSRAQAWVDLLLSASYKPRTFFIRGIQINLNPGELAHSQLTLAKRWKWNFKTVVNFLKMLEKREMVETKTNNVTTVISIKNWNQYQNNGDQSGDQVETKTETYNKVNNVNKYNSLDSIKNDASLIDEFKERFNLTDVELSNEFYAMETWLESSGKPKKNYKMFCLNWLKKYSANRNNGQQKKSEEVLEFYTNGS